MLAKFLKEVTDTAFCLLKVLVFCMVKWTG